MTMSIQFMSNTSRTLVLGVLAALLGLTPAPAQSSAEREIAPARERIGASRDRQDRPGREDPEEILRGLRQGMNALRALGRMDALEQMERITAEVEREIAGRRARTDPDNREIRAARRQVQVMRMGLRALAAEERDDAADLLERAIVVREMAIEGRRDEAAARMRESAPSRGNQAELLMLASRILAERGREDRAEMVREYARQLANQARRIRRAGEQGERPAVRDREAAGPGRMERIESLEARLRQLQESMRELQAALRAIRRNR